MVCLEKIEFYVPDQKIPVSQMGSRTQLPQDILKVFEKLYGLKDIAVCENMSLMDFVSIPVDKLLSGIKNKHCIKYVIHAHTAEPILPFGHSIPRGIKQKFGLHEAIAFSTSTQKCVSALSVLQVLTNILEEDTGALILTGEIAFTPELRVVPRSSITSDAAVAVLISGSGERHRLLSVETVLLPGYSEGIYLSSDMIQKFDDCFVETMRSVLLTAIQKAGLTLEDIRLILPHNVNYPTWYKVARTLSVPIEKIYLEAIPRFGHCFNSDGFLNLVFAEKEQRIHRGDYYLMAGCGIGFFFSCAVFQY